VKILDSAGIPARNQSLGLQHYQEKDPEATDKERLFSGYDVSLAIDLHQPLHSF
jgi:hypothetical protein